MRILPSGNLLFSGKQRVSLSTAYFPMHVDRGKLVDKEILCLPLNFPLIHMRAGNLEGKGKFSLLHEQ